MWYTKCSVHVRTWFKSNLSWQLHKSQDGVFFSWKWITSPLHWCNGHKIVEYVVMLRYIQAVASCLSLQLRLETGKETTSKLHRGRMFLLWFISQRFKLSKVIGCCRSCISSTTICLTSLSSCSRRKAFASIWVGEWLLLSWKSIGLNLLRLNVSLFRKCPLLNCFRGFYSFVSRFLAFREFLIEENLLRFVSCVINFGPSRFSIFFFSAILSLKDHDADCYPKIRLVSSETAHPGYLKNLVAARWNIFQCYFLYRVIDSCHVEFCFAETVRNGQYNSHTFTRSWCNLSARARRSLTSESASQRRVVNIDWL